MTMPLSEGNDTMAVNEESAIFLRPEDVLISSAELSSEPEADPDLTAYVVVNRGDNSVELRLENADEDGTVLLSKQEALDVSLALVTATPGESVLEIS